MGPNLSYGTGGEGFCIYLLDPSVEGYDTDFDTSGPLGFGGKAGALLGVGIDLAGNFSCGPDQPRKPNSVSVRGGTGELLSIGSVPGGVGSVDWRNVEITFDLTGSVLRCTVQLGQHTVLCSKALPGVHLSNKVVIGVCAACSGKLTNAVAINSLELCESSVASTRSPRSSSRSPRHTSPYSQMADGQEAHTMATVEALCADGWAVLEQGNPGEAFVLFDRALKGSISLYTTDRAHDEVVDKLARRVAQGRALAHSRLSDGDPRQSTAPVRPSETRIVGRLRVGLRSVGGLSLIHISEPTRPY
eukprot:TRINITY_DN6279_c0_g1_i1.p1 TRINITY_DN6279_c0_g1~~TRINITY_DN6279_c0_g1_i1.p1  ORF type:complete len:303 (-),score=49.75 TRINITY_DN6279_c0_g1_i1:59-967(-)